MKPNIKPFDPCRDGLKYYESKASFEQAWNACPRGDWMLWIAVNLEVDDRTLTRAKALCANTVRHLMKDERSRAAVDAALRYADGKTGPKELKRYADYARDAYRDAKASEAAAHAAYAANWDAHAAYWAASYAAAHAAEAAYWAAEAAYWAARAAEQAAVAANWAAEANRLETADEAFDDSRLETANICREVLTGAVFEKVKQINDK